MRLQHVLFLPLLILGMTGLPAPSHGQTDANINKSVWKQKYNVLDAQLNEQAPYAGWLSKDEDGDGVTNGEELAAGTNPFPKGPGDVHFKLLTVAANPTELSLTFPTVAGKLYQAESKATLTDAVWSAGTLPSVVGDGTPKMLTVPKSAGAFFHVKVLDQASQNDGVSDWAKQILGYALGSPISAQSSYTSSTLSSALTTQQNVITIAATDSTTTAPVDGSTPAGALGAITVSRGGHYLFSAITVPLSVLTIAGVTAQPGVDYLALPSSVAFPAGVKSVELKVTPLYNASLKTTRAVIVSVGSGGGYTLGSPSQAVVTINPSPTPTGTGLTGTYSSGSSTTYTSSANFNTSTASGFTRVDPAIDFVFPAGPGVPENTGGTEVNNVAPVGTITTTSTSPYTVRWKGQVQPQYSQTYFFVVRSDDGAKLFVNGQLVVDKWVAQSVRDQVGAITLQGGVLYDIQLDYFQISGGAEAHLSWYSADQTKQIVPQSRLYPLTTGVAGATPPAITSASSVVAFANHLYSTTVADPPLLTVTASNGPNTFALAPGSAPLPTGLTLHSGTGAITGTPTVAGSYQVAVQATNAAGTGSAGLSIQVVISAGTITREIWTGLAGPNVSDIPVNTPPASTDTSLTSLEDNSTQTGAGTSTGERLRGYITVPTSGNYYFYLAANGDPAATGNVAELWVSNNSEAVNKVRRCFTTGPNGTATRDYLGQAKQRSGWLALVGGQKYYFEVLHNLGAGGPTPGNLAVGWFMDPTGSTTVNAGNTATLVSVTPGFVLSPWDNPATTAVTGSLYITNLSSLPGVNTPASGSAYLRLTGSTALVHYFAPSGLTSPVTSKGIYTGTLNSPVLAFDLDAQDKFYPDSKTNDAAYTWSGLSGPTLTSLTNGTAFLLVKTVANPNGEIYGALGRTDGSQVAPAMPSYPVWTDNHSTSDAQNSRFLTQATFGPSPADMSSVKLTGYNTWINNQFGIAASHHTPYVLANLNSDPTNAYPSDRAFNSWWQQSVTAPDQLRQRLAFALSEILVISDAGPLNNEARYLSPYYDILLDNCFGNFRDILKNVTLSPAMGVYLDMRANDETNVATGLHPNENYAREIMQLFSLGLYRLWPDATLVLDSAGNPVPTYDQSVITGFARVLTGWNWNQSLQGNGRLPTNFSPAKTSQSYFSPMTLVPTHHELGSKIGLDNVILPAANVAVAPASIAFTPISTPAAGSQADSSNSGALPPNNLFDNYCTQDLETLLDQIMDSPTVAPFICRQLIQRLVTSHPQADYVHRVARAFNGEQFVDAQGQPIPGNGVRGNMQEVVRAILLDYEARSITAKSAITFGKQREPLLRVSGPARSFLPSDIPGSTYRGLGAREMLITTPAAHRLSTGDTVFLDNIVDAGASTTNLPTAQSYSVSNATPAYTLAAPNLPYTSVGNTVTITAAGYVTGDPIKVKFATGGLSTGGAFDNTYPIATATPTNFTITLPSSPANASGNCYFPTTTVTITAPGYQVGDAVNIQFTSGTLGSTAPYNTAQPYTVTGATPTNFTITIGSNTFAGTSGNTVTPNNFTVNAGSLSAPNYNSVGNTVTITATGYTAGHQLFVQFASGGLLGAGFNGLYAVATATASNFTITLPSTPANTSGTCLIPRLTGGYTVTTVSTTSTITVATSGNHGLNVGDQVQLDFTKFNSPTPAVDGIYTVTSIQDSDHFAVTTTPAISNGSEGGSINVYPLATPPLTRSGTLTIELGTWNIGSNTALTQTPLNAPSVFNYFYPDYQFPGDIAAAGLTTPEFQLSNDTATMSLTNVLTQGILNAGNTNGFTSFFSGGGAIVMDLSPYMTSAQTSNAGIATLVDKMNDLLTGGNMQAATITNITNYVANVTNFPLSTPPTNSQMRDRVRAIVHMILISPEYAIQK